MVRRGVVGARHVVVAAGRWWSWTATQVSGPEERTYATILDDEITFTDRMKADLMSQAQFLQDSHVSRGELHASAAVLLDAALAA